MLVALAVWGAILVALLVHPTPRLRDESLAALQLAAGIVVAALTIGALL